MNAEQLKNLAKTLRGLSKIDLHTLAIDYGVSLEFEIEDEEDDIEE